MLRVVQGALLITKFHEEVCKGRRGERKGVGMKFSKLRYVEKLKHPNFFSSAAILTMKHFKAPPKSITLILRFSVGRPQLDV